MSVSLTAGTSIYLGRRKHIRKVLLKPGGQHDEVGDAIYLLGCPPQGGMDYDSRTVIHHFERDFQVLGEASVTVMLANPNAGLRVHTKPRRFKFFTLSDQEIIKGV